MAEIAADNQPVVRFYCSCCGEHQPVDIEPLTVDELNRHTAWGDILCRKCHFVIATMSVDEKEAGVYKIVKVSES